MIDLRKTIQESSVLFADSPNLDGFGRLKTAHPETVFDAQLTYGLQPLLYEPVTSGAGATITHDATNRRANISFSSTPSGNVCYLQSYEHLRYQPGKSQEVNITFNFGAAVTDCICFARYGDFDNSFEFYQDGTGDLYFVIRALTG